MAEEMTAEIIGSGKKKKLRIELPLIDPPTPSSSGNTLLVATSHGNKELACKVNGQNIRCGVNAYIYPDKE